MTTPYMTGKRMPLKATFVVSILRSPDMSKVIRRPPIAPRGGDVYVYSIENNMHREAWKNDNIHFHHDGTRGQPKTNPIVRKIFFCAMVGDGRWTRDFMKHVYTLYHNPNNFVVIHYLGDESIARDVPRHRKPRSNTKKHTTCSSTAIQVDTSELSPLSCSSDQQEDDHMMGEDGGHEDEDDDYSELVELGEPTVEIDAIDDDSGIAQSQVYITLNDYHSEGTTSEASTSTGAPFTSTPNPRGNFMDPIPLSCLDMMPMTNPLGILSEVTLSCRPLEHSAPQFNPNEPSTSYGSFGTFSGGGAGNSNVSTPRESEPSSVIPKKRLAMRLEGQEGDVSNGEILTQSPTIGYFQPAGLLPKKRRLEYTESSQPIPGPSSAFGCCQAPVDDPGDANDTGQSSSHSSSDGIPEIHPNSTVVVSELSSPQSRTNTPRLRHSVRQGFQNSILSLVQNVQNLQTMLGDQGMWEQSREMRDASTDAEPSRPSIETYIQNLVSSGQIALIVAKVMQLATNWKQRPSAFNSRYNACMTLICQVRASWGEDMETARTKLMEVLGKNPVSECDVKNYYHLVTACVVGAYRMQVALNRFLTTLSAWPSHLEECDTRTEVEVEESVTCIVGRTLLNGTQLKTLEKTDPADAQVIKAYLQLLVSHWTSCLPHHCFLLPSGLQKLWEKGDYTRGMLDKDTLTDYTWILMPYQASDTHWVLLVANVQERTVSVVNTAKDKYPNISVEIIDHWRKYMKFRSSHTGQNLTRWKMQELPVFEQTDQTSSGVQVMMAAESILCGASPVVMRTCHVRRYRQYAISRLLSAANFDFEDSHFDDLLDDNHGLQEEDNLPGDDDGSPQSVDRESSRSTSTSGVVVAHTACSTACASLASPSSAVTVTSRRQTLPVSVSSCEEGRKRCHSSSDTGDQEKAIDFSRCQSTVPSEDGQPKSCDDLRTSDQSPNHPKEHNYANRRSSTQTSAYEIPTVSATPAHEDPKCSTSRNVSNTVPDVPSFQVTGFLFQPRGFVPPHQPPMYPGRIDNLYRGGGHISNISTLAVQEKPCDMSMQSQLALDSQPSTSSQFSYLQEMESGGLEVEDLRVNTTSSYRASPEHPAYHVSESAGATYTELSNVRPSDLQPSSLITSSFNIVENENVDLKTFHRRHVPSPSSASDNSSETINVVSLSPHPGTPIIEQADDYVSNPGPSTSRGPEPSSSNMAATSGTPSTSGMSRLAEELDDGQSMDSVSGDNDRNMSGDLSNLDMLSTVATKDAS